MKSRNVLKLLFVIFASASVAKQSSAILPAVLVPTSVAGKCAAGLIALPVCSIIALAACNIIHGAMIKCEENIPDVNEINEKIIRYGILVPILITGYIPAVPCAVVDSTGSLCSEPKKIPGKLWNGCKHPLKTLKDFGKKINDYNLVLACLSSLSAHRG